MAKRLLAWFMTACAFGAVIAITLTAPRAEPGGSVRTGKGGIEQSGTGTGKQP